MEHNEQQRTTQQNRSLHLAFTQISKQLNADGIDQKALVSALNTFDCPTTPEFVKEVFKAIIFSMYRITSTRDLSIKQIDEAFSVLAKFLAENYHYTISFPSIETLMEAQLDKPEYQ